MKKLFIALLVAQSFVQFADAQERYFTREGSVSFFSATPVENIEADNKKLQSVIDMSSGAFEFAALIKSFEFEKALMEEHFNENYMESNTYPKATFRGKIENLEELKSKGFPSSATAMAKGVMTIHGVDQEVEIPAHLVKVSNGYNVTCKFNVKPQDYEIEIPNAVQDKIAKEIEVTVDAVLNPMK
jgi:hypothetical protein